MAQNFESFYEPQQIRRNKLRLTSQSHQDPTIIALSSQQILTSLSPPSLKDLNHQSQVDCQECHSVSSPGDFLKQSGEARSSVPLGPFTGYASILKTSRFLKPAQQILDDLCGVNCEVLDLPLDFLSESEVMGESIAHTKGLEYRWKNTNLTLMLEELYRRYKLFCHQMHSVVASFRTVAGLGNAAPYICYAIKIVPKHFTCLKTAMLEQIQFTGKIFDGVAKENCPAFWAAEQGSQSTHRSNNPDVCRSQRGFPDHAVAVLKAWLFEHFLHPYPTDSEKHNLALQTGLSRNQVSNWFINARVRLWKPMVEEVHMLESQQAQVPLDEVNNDANFSPNFPLKKLPRTTENQCCEIIQTKRSRNEHPDDIPKLQGLERRSKYNNSGASESKDVSLALGLRQSHMIQYLPLGFSTNNMAHPVNLERISMMGSTPATKSKAQSKAQNLRYI